jgi:hypothetical protein
MAGLLYENGNGQFESVTEEDIKELAELLDLKKWQVDRLGYWLSTFERSEEDAGRVAPD